MRYLKKIIALVLVFLIIAYIVLAVHAAANWNEPQKGPPAWIEWQGEGQTIL
jgi:hypothetical protein